MVGGVSVGGGAVVVVGGTAVVTEVTGGGLPPPVVHRPFGGLTEPSGHLGGWVVGQSPFAGLTDPSEHVIGGFVVGQSRFGGLVEPSLQVTGGGQVLPAGLVVPSEHFSGVGHDPPVGFVEPSGHLVGHSPVAGFCEPSGQVGRSGHSPLGGCTEPSQQYVGCFDGHTPDAGFRVPSSQYTGLLQSVPQPSRVPVSSQLWPHCCFLLSPPQFSATAHLGGFVVVGGTFAGAPPWGAGCGTVVVVIGAGALIPGLAQPIPAGSPSARSAASRRTRCKVRGENLTARASFACRSPPARRVEFREVFIRRDLACSMVRPTAPPPPCLSLW